MNDRIRLDDLTSDQYDQLCDQLDALRQVARGYCPDCGRGGAAPTVADWERERDRAQRASAVVERVSALAAGAARATAAGTSDYDIGRHELALAVLAVLEEITPAEEARLAQSGIRTPGCDCGHEGMGVSWHGDDCPWLRGVLGGAAWEQP